MKIKCADRLISVFTVLPRNEVMHDYSLARIEKFISLSEEYNYSGILLFQSQLENVEPWVFAQEVLAKSTHLSPFVAVNPVYSHPFAIANRILTLSKLYNRRLNLNFITGTSTSDLKTLGLHLEHGERYERLIEYAEIVVTLLRSKKGITRSGKYYTVHDLVLPDTLEEELMPVLYIAGASESASRASQLLKANTLKMALPEDAEPVQDMQEKQRKGIHFGLIARESPEAAQEVMMKYFPKDDEGPLLFDYALANTDAVWKKELNHESKKDEGSVYTLKPFSNFKSDCPYLVGAYHSVSDAIKNYIRKGYTSFVIEVLSDEEFFHMNKVFQTVYKEMDQEAYNGGFVF